jgi:polysaccharide export outer membrane protein
MKSFVTLITALVLGLLSLGAPAQADDYKIQPGDVLKLEVLEDPSLDRTVLVAPDGRISLPQAGSIAVTGKSVDAISAALAAKLAPGFATAPTVSVSLQQLAPIAPAGAAAQKATISVYVLGEAAKPGRLDVTRGTTVLQAFAEFGGFSKFAATKRIVLRRTDAKTGAETNFPLNYDAIAAGKSANGSVTLKTGDVILIPQRGLFE